MENPTPDLTFPRSKKFVWGMSVVIISLIANGGLIWWVNMQNELWLAGLFILLAHLFFWILSSIVAAVVVARVQNTQMLKKVLIWLFAFVILLPAVMLFVFKI